MTRDLAPPVEPKPATGAAFTTRFRSSGAGAVVTLTLAAFFVLGLRLLTVGAGDLGVAGLFSTDEQLAGELVRAMFRQGDLGLSHFFSYGPLDLYAARALLWPYGALRPVSDEAILVALRLVSLLAGAGCLAAIYLLGVRIWNAATGAMAALLLALCPTVFAWSVTAHPDTLQLLFLLLGLYYAVQLAIQPSRVSLILASAFAALAFATKYGGVLLLPVIWLAAATHARPRRPLACCLEGITSVSVFVAVFLLLDPSVLSEPRRFLSQARVESDLAHHGHLLATAADPLGWLRMLGGPELLGPVALALALAALASWTVFDLRAAVEALSRRCRFAATRQHPSFPPAAPAAGAALARLPLEAWTLGYLVLLLLWIGDRQPRYALPLLPGLDLFAAAAIIWLARRLPAAHLVLAMLLVAAILPPGLRLVGYERAQARRMENPDVAARLAAGRWLAEHTEPSTPILRDAYSYVPPAFSHVDETFGLSHAEIQSRRPAIIMTDASIDQRFRDPSTALSYRDGPAAYAEIAATYRELESGTLACYPLLRRFGPVSIYGRLAQPAAGGVC